MRHGVAGRKLSRRSAHREAMFANLATSLLKHGQIKTTLPKAKDLRRVVEPIITKAKKGDLAARREVMKTITEKEVVAHLFDNIVPAMAKREGGYTRVLKAGFRQGDAADMAVVQLVDQPEKAFGAEQSAKKETKSAEKKAAPKKEAAAKDEKKSEAKTSSSKKAAPKKAEKDAE